MLLYCDTSALVKLVIIETETAELLGWLATFAEPVLISNAVARTELVRAVRSHGPDKVAKARLLIEKISLVMPDNDLFDAAGDVEPPVLRSLDALHLATVQ